MMNRIVTAFKIASEYLRKGQILTLTGEIPQSVKYHFEYSTKIFKQHGVQFQTNAYNNCPNVQEIISKKSKSLLAGNLICVDADGNEIKNTAFNKAMDLLKNPNAYQTYSNFISTVYTFQQVYGVAYIFKIMAEGFKDPQALFVVPNTCIEVVYKTRGAILLNDRKELIDYYSINLNGTIYKIYDINQIVEVHDIVINTDLGGSIKTSSRIDCLKQPIINIIASLECRGQYISNHGADVAISPERSNDAGALAIGFNDTERERIQADYSRYGIMAGQYHALVSKIPLKIQNFGRSVVDLGLFDGENQDYRYIASGYGVPTPILGLPDTSKYSTYEQAKKEFYQDTILPESAIIAEALTTIFKAIGWKFSFDYSSLEIMQESEKEKADTLKVMGESLKQAVEAGFLTQQEATKVYNTYL